MNETYELVSAHGDGTYINLVSFLIHFEDSGHTASHYVEIPLTLSIDVSSTEQEAIDAGLLALGDKTLTSIRGGVQNHLNMLKNFAANPSIYFKTIDSLKVDKHTERKAARISAINSGFLYGNANVASDLESRMLIQGAAQLAQMALTDGSQTALDQFTASLVGGWRAVDDTIVASDAAGMIALAQSLAQHVAACDANSQSIKAAINAATTLAELGAIDVGAGY